MSGTPEAPTYGPAPCPPQRVVGYIQVYTFFFKQTEQCLVWNVFKEKADSAECEWTEREAVLFQKNMQRFRASVESEDFHSFCQK